MKYSKLVTRSLPFFAALAGVYFVLSTVPAGTAPPEPKISWSPCYKDFGPFECGTVQVPLDYNNPGVAAISISLVRLPATDPSRRIGSLFFNPGGPGGSGVEFVLLYGPYIYSEEVRARFDLVGFDPRGIGRSTALRCYGTPRQWIFAPFPFPLTPAQEEVWEAADLYLANACDQRGFKIVDHMSTADVARDLDLLRRAVRDEKLNYVGYSYGSYLGQVYANMYPGHVGAIVIDGILDPIAWSTGAPGEENLPFSTRLHSAAGARDTLNEFFRLCDLADPPSPFSGDSVDRFAALAEELKTNPLVITYPDGSTFTFTYAHLISNALGAMYNSFAWPSFANFLAAIEAMASPTVLGTRLYSLWEDLGFITKRGIPRYYNWAEGFPAVCCADSDNPDTYGEWSAAAALAESQDGYFGPLWTWISSICATWSGSQDDRYIGDFDAYTPNPILIVNTLFDPATRYESALAVADLLPNSRLLSVNGWGHTTPFLSYDADMAVSEFLLYGTLPDEGTIYDQDYVPFQDASAVTVSEAALRRAEMTAIMVPDAVRKGVQIKK